MFEGAAPATVVPSRWRTYPVSAYSVTKSLRHRQDGFRDRNVYYLALAVMNVPVVKSHHAADHRLE